LQYLELLTSPSVIPPKDYAGKVLPPIAELAEVYGISAPICMQIIRPVLQASLLVCGPFPIHSVDQCCSFNTQCSALAMAEQERIAGEEAEKRLKAALTAKREPTSTSRIASPRLGTPTPLEVVAHSNPAVEDTSVQEDVSMEVEANAVPSPAVPEVSHEVFQHAIQN
jgi:THO complex subunit 2